MILSLSTRNKAILRYIVRTLSEGTICESISPIRKLFISCRSSWRNSSDEIGGLAMNEYPSGNMRLLNSIQLELSESSAGGDRRYLHPFTMPDIESPFKLEANMLYDYFLGQCEKRFKLCWLEPDQGANVKFPHKGPIRRGFSPQIIALFERDFGRLDAQ